MFFTVVTNNSIDRYFGIFHRPCFTKFRQTIRNMACNLRCNFLSSFWN